jgi:hypothetical protein
MAIAPSKLGQFVERKWTWDWLLVRRLRKAGLVMTSATDDELKAVLRRVWAEHLAFPEYGRRFNSPHERVCGFLEPYLTDKGQKWAVPLESLDLPDE